MNKATKITIGTIVLSALLVGVLVANLALA
jgi:hypothetical protein